jgi:hypothetical protein
MNHAKGNTEIHSFQAIALCDAAEAVAVASRFCHKPHRVEPPGR